MAKISCPICNQKQISFYIRAQRTDYYQCFFCKLIFAKKLPRLSYADYNLDNYFKLEGFLKNAIRKQVKSIKNYKPKGKILEIGSGMGYMMEILKAAGFQIDGIEPSDRLVTLSHKKSLKVKKGYFEKLPIKQNSYDAVIMNHVLEHVQNPIVFLKKVKKVLKKNGIIFLQVPNFGSFEARIMKKNWSYLVPNDHYLQFTHQTLRNLLEKSDFEIIEARTTGIDNELDSLSEELLRCLKNDRKRLIYYLIGLIPVKIENWFNQGTALWYIAH